MTRTPNKTPGSKFVQGSNIISKPGASIVVRELILTEYGQRAIMSGSKGIKEGAREQFGPPRRKKELAPA